MTWPPGMWEESSQDEGVEGVEVKSKGLRCQFRVGLCAGPSTGSAILQCGTRRTTNPNLLSIINHRLVATCYIIGLIFEGIIWLQRMAV